MTTLEVRIDLPESLAKEAQQAGVLALEESGWCGEALRAKRVEGLSKACCGPLPPMTAEEIQAEVDAYRAQVRRAAGA